MLRACTNSRRLASAEARSGAGQAGQAAAASTLREPIAAIFGARPLGPRRACHGRRATKPDPAARHQPATAPYAGYRTVERPTSCPRRLLLRGRSETAVGVNAVPGSMSKPSKVATNRLIIDPERPRAMLLQPLHPLPAAPTRMLCDAHTVERHSTPTGTLQRMLSAAGIVTSSWPAGPQMRNGSGEDAGGIGELGVLLGGARSAMSSTSPSTGRWLWRPEGRRGWLFRRWRLS